MGIQDGFRSYLEEQGKSENTIQTYCRAVGLYVKWYRETFGQDAEQLYRINVLDYISYLRTVRKLSNQSVNLALAALQCLNEHLLETGAQNELTISKKDYLKVQQRYASPSTVSREQVEAFRQQVLVGRGKRDHAIVTVLAYAGLRISEALSLETEDVDLVSREIKVQRGKGDKSRVVFIGDKVVNAVREYLRERPKTGSAFLFISRKGDRLSRSQVNRIFNAYSDHITPHTLRHFYCSAAIEAGYSINEVANQAGHANIHTTLLYTNPTREKMKEKANLL